MYLSFRTFLVIAISTAIFLTVSAEVEIKLKPLDDVLQEVKDDFAGIFFEPYFPASTVDRSCYDVCPCGDAPCACEVEKVCGGAISTDLSVSDKISFHWDASSNNTKYISIKGNGRTRVEFQGKVDCDINQEEEIRGTDITFEVDDSGLDDVASQNYVYNPDESFVIFGRCAMGCDKCEIYTRLQFDPKDGVLDLNLKGLKYSASYDSQNVLVGEHEYQWGTNSYCWMRDSNDSRRDRALAEQNTYELLDLPATSGSVTTTAYVATFLSITVSVMIFFLS